MPSKLAVSPQPSQPRSRLSVRRPLAMGLEDHAASRMSTSWIRPQSANPIGLPGGRLYPSASHSSLNQQVKYISLRPAAAAPNLSARAPQACIDPVKKRCVCACHSVSAHSSTQRSRPLWPIPLRRPTSCAGQKASSGMRRRRATRRTTSTSARRTCATIYRGLPDLGSMSVPRTTRRWESRC